MKGRVYSFLINKLGYVIGLVAKFRDQTITISFSFIYEPC